MSELETIISDKIGLDRQACACGKGLPIAQAQHVYNCLCGRLWLRADCSEVCEGWIEYA